MENKKTCCKCNSDMIKSYTKGDFSFIGKLNICTGCETERYMCKECGYIEEYGIDFKSKLK